jgi:hypothetical protein
VKARPIYVVDRVLRAAPGAGRSDPGAAAG